MTMKHIEFTKEEIDSLFEGTNFGLRSETHEGRIMLMVDCVFKSFAGYSSGSTIEGICAEAGLLSERDKPTRAGARWAYNQVHLAIKESKP
jgi:hypothetical protein